MILHYPVNYTQNPWIVYLKSKFCGMWQTKQVPDTCSRRRAIGTLFISLFLTYKFSIKKKTTFDCSGSLTYKKNCRLLFCSPRVRLLGGLFVHFSQTFECTLTGVCVYLNPKWNHTVVWTPCLIYVGNSFSCQWVCFIISLTAVSYCLVSYNSCTKSSSLDI